VVTTRDQRAQTDSTSFPEKDSAQEKGSPLPAFIQGMVKKSTTAILKTPARQTKGPKTVEAPTARRSGRLAAKAMAQEVTNWTRSSFQLIRVSRPGKGFSSYLIPPCRMMPLKP
jgi:hypothetical protein